jgi:hypothetical protein
MGSPPSAACARPDVALARYVVFFINLKVYKEKDIKKKGETKQGTYGSLCVLV